MVRGAIAEKSKGILVGESIHFGLLLVPVDGEHTTLFEPELVYD